MESDKLLKRKIKKSEGELDGLSGYAATVLMLVTLFTVSFFSTAADHNPYSLSIFKGHDIEVCPYYRDALAESAKHRIPYCDRNIDSPSPPFSGLDRAYLDVAEIVDIYEKVESFRITSDQLYSERVNDPFLYPTWEQSLKFIESLLRTKQLLVWKLSPMVDIDNSGQADSVLVWRYGRCYRYRPRDA